jgi:hypothetical protein
MRIRKYFIYMFFILLCLMLSNCQFFKCLFYDLVITEPQNGLETKANEITVSGCGSNSEINELELFVNNMFVDLKNIVRISEDEYFSFDFFSVTIPNGNVEIEVIGYSNWPVDEIASDSVSIFCDRSPPNIVITSPENNAIIYSHSVTFVGSISDNDQVQSFQYLGEYGHSGDIHVENGNWSVTVENLPYIYQYVTFIAKDRMANIKSETIYFTCSE